MPSVVTNYAKEIMINAISGSDMKIALLNDIVLSSESNLKDFRNWSELSAYEVSGIGYTAGGITLSGTSGYSSSADDKAYFNGNSVIWDNISVSAYGYALYRSNSGLVISIVEFSGDKPKVANKGSFCIEWNNNIILQMIG